MEKRTKRKYTQEFREEAVKLVTEQGYTIAETARNLGAKEVSDRYKPPTSAVINGKSGHPVFRPLRNIIGQNRAQANGTV